MNRQELETSVSQVLSATPYAVEEFSARQELLLALMNQNMMNRPDIFELIGGEKNIQMMKDNHANHLRFIASILATPNTRTFIEVLQWVFRAYQSHGFNSKYWKAQINTWISLFKENLSLETCESILPLYSWMERNLPLIQAIAEKNEEKSSL